MSLNELKWYVQNWKPARYILDSLKITLCDCKWVMKEVLPQLGAAIFNVVLMLLLLAIYPITYIFVRKMFQKIQKEKEWYKENE